MTGYFLSVEQWPRVRNTPNSTTYAAFVRNDEGCTHDAGRVEDLLEVDSAILYTFRRVDEQAINVSVTNSLAKSKDKPPQMRT